ncbi:MAG: sensor histidine kinase [Flammeovirgaceae bacterium]
MIGFPIHIILAYFHIYYLLPKFILRKRYVEYGILLLLSLVVLMVIKTELNNYFLHVVWPEAHYEPEDIYNLNYAIIVMLGELYVVGVTTSIKLTVDWVSYQRRTSDLEKRNLETELDFLKSQIQPHFFFNTLNNLYALTLEKSDLAPEIVLKLSELMNYILYKANQTRRVSLMEEVQYIQSYLDLEMLRFGKRLQLDFSIEGSLDGKVVAPLIMLPFIENTFKHGVGNQLEKIDIHIEIKALDDYLIFQIDNPKAPKAMGQHFKLPEQGGGIGLKNVKRRLELLYHDDYTLEVGEEGDRYKVMLKIPSS